jgi:hypothetical protein
MKRWFVVLFIISLLLSGFFVFLQIVQNRYEPVDFESGHEGDTVRLNIAYQKKKFFTGLKRLYPEISTKKYLFMNLYSCSARAMDEIPILDTVIEPLREDMAYLLVSPAPKKEVSMKLKERNISDKNFLNVNESDSFILTLCREIKKKPLYIWDSYEYLPFSIVCDSSGKILYVDTMQAFSGFKMDTLIDREHAQKLRKTLRAFK